MNSSSTRIVIACLWVASLGGAYFIGRKNPEAAAFTSERSGIGDLAAKADSATTASQASSSAPGSAKGERPAVKDIILQARAAMGSGMGGFMNMRGMLRALAPLAELTEEEVQQALAEVEQTVKEPQQKMMFYSMLLSQWAETDGPAAMAYAKEKLQGQGPMMASVTASVVGTWARRDPEAVWRWYLDAREKGERGPMGGGAEGYLAGIFNGMAAASIDTALGRLSSLAEFERPQAIQGIAMSSMDPRVRESLLTRAASLDAQTRGSLYQGLIGTWMMTDSEGATKWLAALPEEERKPLVTVAGSSLMFMNPEKGAEIQVQNTSEKELPQTYSRIVMQWANRDPLSAGEWLNKQPQGPQLDEARRSFATAIVNRDPAGAYDWAKAVQDDGKRMDAYTQVYRTMSARNQTDADAALDRAGLPNEWVAKIRESVTPQNAQPVPTR